MLIDMSLACPIGSSQLNGPEYRSTILLLQIQGTSQYLYRIVFDFNLFQVFL